MSKRKPIPQITPQPTVAIDDLLDPKGGMTEKQKSSKSKSSQVKKTVKQNAGKATSKDSGKSKCTYYIPTELSERIDFAHAQARVYTRSSRYKASKSEFIEAALLYALDEFDKHGRKSDIVNRLTALIDN